MNCFLSIKTPSITHSGERLSQSQKIYKKGGGKEERKQVFHCHLISKAPEPAVVVDCPILSQKFCFSTKVCQLNFLLIIKQSALYQLIGAHILSLRRVGWSIDWKESYRITEQNRLPAKMFYKAALLIDWNGVGSSRVAREKTTEDSPLPWALS